MLDATGYADPSAPYPAPPKDRPYAEEVLRSPGKLRIAFSSETPNGRPIDPEIQSALERTAALLKGLGHEVIERGLGIDYRAYREMAARGALSLPRWLASILLSRNIHGLFAWSDPAPWIASWPRRLRQALERRAERLATFVRQWRSTAS